MNRAASAAALDFQPNSGWWRRRELNPFLTSSLKFAGVHFDPVNIGVCSCRGGGWKTRRTAFSRTFATDFCAECAECFLAVHALAFAEGTAVFRWRRGGKSSRDHGDCLVSFKAQFFAVGNLKPSAKTGEA